MALSADSAGRTDHSWQSCDINDVVSWVTGIQEPLLCVHMFENFRLPSLLLCDINMFFLAVLLTCCI